MKCTQHPKYTGKGIPVSENPDCICEFIYNEKVVKALNKVKTKGVLTIDSSWLVETFTKCNAKLRKYIDKNDKQKKPIMDDEDAYLRHLMN